MATIVAFHAHPDDEVVLTGGTLARAVAAGHRVVVVAATDGYGPVFFPDPPGRVRFARADLDEAARRLAAILRDEDAELLLSYQSNGGYGHRDHVMVHRVGSRAAELARTPRVLEVTMPREALRQISTLARLLRLPPPYESEVVRTAYAARATITHRIDVRRFARQKRDALAAHRSQVSGVPVWSKALPRVPIRAFALLFGREWFVDPAAPPGVVLRDTFGEPTRG